MEEEEEEGASNMVGGGGRRRAQPSSVRMELCNSPLLPPPSSHPLHHEGFYSRRAYQAYPALLPLPLPPAPPAPVFLLIPPTPLPPQLTFHRSKNQFLQKNSRNQKPPLFPPPSPRFYSSDVQGPLLPIPQDMEFLKKKPSLVTSKEGKAIDVTATLNGDPTLPSPMATARRPDHCGNEDMEFFLKKKPSLVTTKAEGKAKDVTATFNGDPTLPSPMATARRPDHGGNEGSTVSLLANHFLVQFDPKPNIFHYDVDISPRPSKEIARKIKRKLVIENSDILSGSMPVFDGRRNLYSSVEFREERIELFVSLPMPKPQSLNKGDDLNVFVNQKSKLFRISIRLASTLSGEDLNKYLKEDEMDGIPLPQEYLHALDIVLREKPAESCISVGRSLFTSSMGGVKDIGGGAVGFRGFFQSLRPTQQGLALNLDFSVSAFHESIGIIPYLQKHCNSLRDLSERRTRCLGEEEKKEVEKALKNIRIFACHRETDQRYRVYSLTNEVAENLKFRDRDGSDLSLVEYFRDHYNHEIQFKNLPCLQISRSKPCYLPMELCMVCDGQKFLGKLSDDQTAKIFKMGCQRPAARRDIINQIMKGDDGPTSGCYAKEFNLNISREMTQLQGRVLQPPKLKLGDGGHVRDLTPTRHDRQWNLLNSHVTEPSMIKRWALISFGGSSDQRSSVPKFVAQLAHRCEQFGITLSKTTVVPPLFLQTKILTNAPALERDLRKIHESVSGDLQLLIFLLEKKHRGYADLKRIAETGIGIVSQCCLYPNLAKLSSQFLTNLALKINAKLGGSNVALYDSIPRQFPRIFGDDEPAIFVGADVTHPHPLDDSSPSVAAVVASMNWPAANKYVSRMRSQTHRREIIEELEQMVFELLEDFVASVRKLPGRIIFFRDGVSETQFQKVLKDELRAIRIACTRFSNYKPDVTFVVVQKRHHTRLFLNEKSGDTPHLSAENIPPGTVVDTVITHPREFDFYLCSHWGMKGTSRPTHYHVLWDENKFKSDEFQKLIHDLCYTFARCTKPVSIVPPAYYAHLAAYRGRLYLERGDTRVARPTTISRAAPAQTVPLPKVRDSVKKLMFYC